MAHTRKMSAVPALVRTGKICGIDTTSLAGRTALVTGASRGLGRAIAIELARRGAAVAVAARSEKVWDERLPGTIHETVATIRAFGGTAVACPADLLVEDEADRLVKQAVEQLGPLDVLVNNAALTVGGRPGAAAGTGSSAVRLAGPPSLTEVPVKAYRRHLALNVIAPYRLMQLALPHMLSAGRGNIINISSRAAFEPGSGPYATPGRPALFAYGSTKAALHVLTQAAAVEGAARGVAANVLIPSQPIATPGTTLLYHGGDQPDWGSAEDFARVAAHLSEVTPDQLTGQIVWHADLLDTIGGRGQPDSAG
jgi:NAD(P)-dependent dehydrogenase (short-subunit alcohol dehydrogenase family)